VKLVVNQSLAGSEMFLADVGLDTVKDLLLVDFPGTRQLSQYGMVSE
jgi:hypothetical protein